VIVINPSHWSNDPDAILVLDFDFVVLLSPIRCLLEVWFIFSAAILQQTTVFAIPDRTCWTTPFSYDIVVVAFIKKSQ
jgi:hypothetical protein